MTTKTLAIIAIVAVAVMVGIIATASGITATSHIALATKGEAALHISEQGAAHQSEQGAVQSGPPCTLCE
jgi:hypothetical protein